MSKEANKTIAVFDFDGTLTVRDSLWDFLRYTFGSHGTALSLIKNTPILTKYLLKQATNEQAKEKVLSTLLKGMKETEFQTLADRYASERLPQILRKEAVERLAWHRNKGDRIVIISASLKHWIAPWATIQSVDAVLATGLETKNGTFTGKLLGRNCYGQEKVNRLLEYAPDRNSYSLTAYGDGASDKEMLAFADQSFYRRFS